MALLNFPYWRTSFSEQSFDKLLRPTESTGLRNKFLWDPRGDDFWWLLHLSVRHVADRFRYTAHPYSNLAKVSSASHGHSRCIRACRVPIADAFNFLSLPPVAANQPKLASPIKFGPLKKRLEVGPDPGGVFRQANLVCMPS